MTEARPLAGTKDPGGAGMHCDFPWRGWYRPASHTLQCAAPSLEYLPASHSEQADTSTESEYLPAAQGLQRTGKLLPASLKLTYLPGPQLAVG